MRLPTHETLRKSRLEFTDHRRPGISRTGRVPGKWRYFGPTGKPIRSPAALKRIAHLVIPPAWTDVWICPSARGHIQATGHDARGRLQYRYHERWRESRDETKFHRLMDFAHALPAIRRAVARDLRQPELTRTKILATVVRLLETTLVRVGNDEYAKTNGSFGLTTLQRRHVEVGQNRIRLHFRGKSGRFHEIEFADRRIAAIVRRLTHLPGQRLFHYRNGDGRVHPITSSDVNEYLHAVAGDEFSAKDFRTWAATVLASLALQECEPFENPRQAKGNVTAAVARVAQRLGNTPAICRRSYIHPELIGAYLDGSTARWLQAEGERKVRGALRGLSAAEWAVLAFLRKRRAAI